MPRMYDEQWLAERKRRMDLLYGGEKRPQEPLQLLPKGDHARAAAKLVARLRLPFPPTANHAYVSVAGNRRILSEEHRRFRLETGSCVLLALSRGELRMHLEGRLSMLLVLYHANQRFDIDNRVKPTCDALQDAGVFGNDNQFDEISVRRVLQQRTELPTCEAFIWEL